MTTQNMKKMNMVIINRLYIFTSNKLNDMRDIKFRAKRIDNNELVEGYFVIDPKGQCRIYWQPFPEASSNTYHFVIPETVGQFTGLLDKNGKEIFEGDVIAPWPYKTNSNYKLQVAFRFGMFILKAKKPFMPKYKSLHEAMINAVNANAEYEIICSIHDKN